MHQCALYNPKYGSQSETFKNCVPNILELTESFTERVPNFITQIDMSSVSFQMKLSPTSSKYTAFKTCFGTYKLSRVPMRLHASPNSFQLLMDKFYVALHSNRVCVIWTMY
jgi:hypothetical protein